MIIAVDGPAGSGKSTLSKSIAKKLNISYLDTGAMYRMVTLFFLENDLDLNTGISLEELKSKISIKIKGETFFLNDEDVSMKIRDNNVTKNVSKVASLKAVREYLVDAQQQIGESTDIIMDGRDIGTVVFPNAQVKIFLIASAEQRAKRRLEQNKELNVELETYETILEDIKKRDYLDSTREISPLKKAKDAIELDTSNLDLETSEQEMLKIIKERV